MILKTKSYDQWFGVYTLLDRSIGVALWGIIDPGNREFKRIHHIRNLFYEFDTTII